MVVNNVTLYGWGEDTRLLYGNYASNITVTNNKFIGGVESVIKRSTFVDSLYISSDGVVNITNNTFSGTIQGCMVITGDGPGAFTALNIKNNTMTWDSMGITDGYAIELGPNCTNFDVSGNTVQSISGRGILIDDWTTGTVGNGSIYNNNVDVQENGSNNREYGQSGLECTALRLRTETGGRFQNIHIYNNTFYAHTGIGQDHTAIGMRITMTNDSGQNNNTGIVIENNTLKAIVLSDDTSQPSMDAMAIDLARYDAGMGIVYRNNTLESNDISLNLGSNDGWNESGVLFTGTTFVKSSQGITSIRPYDGSTRGYTPIEAGYNGSVVTNVSLTGNTYSGGATPGVIALGSVTYSIDPATGNITFP